MSDISSLLPIIRSEFSKLKVVNAYDKVYKDGKNICQHLLLYHRQFLSFHKAIIFDLESDSDADLAIMKICVV
jgi:hypothetical protein